MASTIPLWPGLAPGSERATHREAVYTGPDGRSVVRNVVSPSLTAYQPSRSTANGTAVIVAPGGGFHLLSWDYEGTVVAERLAARGVTAFVLKYRLQDTGATDGDFEAWVAAFRERYIAAGGLRPVDLANLEPVVRRLAYEDGRQAVRTLRSQAAEWGIDPGKVGFLGFSAGAFVTTAVGLSRDRDARPDFIAPIYGGAVEETIPDDAPPLFASVAADDILCRDTCVATVQAWIAAGRSAELHLYDRGDHGFGAKKLGLPVDSWMDRLLEWMQAHGYLP